MRLYVASSWRNQQYEIVLEALRAAGHDVWDWRVPPNGDPGFSWDEIDIHWKPGEQISTLRLNKMLQHPAAQRGFRNDMKGMMWADACVLLLPCGRSGHMEAGYMSGRGKSVYVLRMYPDEPDLIHLLFDGIFESLAQLLPELAIQEVPSRRGAVANYSPLPAPDPIHCVMPGSPSNDMPGWYFWDEIWANREGPFATREEAAAALAVYAKRLDTVDGENSASMELEAERAAAVANLGRLFGLSVEQVEEAVKQRMTFTRPDLVNTVAGPLTTATHGRTWSAEGVAATWLNIRNEIPGQFAEERNIISDYLAIDWPARVAQAHKDHT